MHMNSSTIHFKNTSNQEFFTVLRKRVKNYFQENKISMKANAAMICKTIIMLMMYFIPLVLIYTKTFSGWRNILLYAIMGFALAGTAMGVAHDANHKAYSSSKFWNKWIGNIMYVYGFNTYVWKVQHNNLHHTFTNIYQHDEDINSIPFLRFSKHALLKSVHRFQHIYALFLYPLLTILRVFSGDFSRFARYTKNGLKPSSTSNPTREFIVLIISKLVYVSFMLLLPIFILNINPWLVIGGFVLMHGIAGLILSVVFSLAHVVEKAEQPLPDSDGNIQNNRILHELATTADFAKKNRPLSRFIGGLNYQIEHHLFPQICHVHYKSIAKIVKQTAKEFTIPYHEYSTFFQALYAHLYMLKQLGQKA